VKTPSFSYIWLAYFLLKSSHLCWVQQFHSSHLWLLVYIFIETSLKPLYYSLAVVISYKIALLKAFFLLMSLNRALHPSVRSWHVYCIIFKLQLRSTFIDPSDRSGLPACFQCVYGMVRRRWRRVILGLQPGKKYRTGIGG
jgi:hypothetical protein